MICFLDSYFGMKIKIFNLSNLNMCAYEGSNPHTQRWMRSSGEKITPLDNR